MSEESKWGANISLGRTPWQLALDDDFDGCQLKTGIAEIFSDLLCFENESVDFAIQQDTGKVWHRYSSQGIHFNQSADKKNAQI